MQGLIKKEWFYFGLNLYSENSLLNAFHKALKMW